jgi:hypothetical protein
MPKTLTLPRLGRPREQRARQLYNPREKKDGADAAAVVVGGEKTE